MVERTYNLNRNSVLNHDLAQLIERAIEPFGRYQIAILLILCYNCTIGAIHDTIPALHIFTPKNFTCIDESIENIQGEGCVPGCKKYSFVHHDTSPITEWSLICDRRYLSAFINSIYFAGTCVSCLVCGVLADKFGGKKLILWCLYLQGILSGSFYFCNSLELFLVLRFLQGFFVEGLLDSSFGLQQELAPPSKSTFTAFVWQIFWSFGLMFLGIAGYLVRDWKLLQVVLSLPVLLTFTWIWLLPESPKWFLTNDKDSAVLKEVVKIARRNRDNELVEDCSVIHLNEFDKTSNQNERATFNHLFLDKTLRKHIVVMVIVWFSVNLIYYGVLLYISYLPGSRHINFTIGALFEIFIIIVAYFCFVSRLGRRHTMIFYQYICAILCCLLAILAIKDTGDAAMAYLIAVVAMVGKGIASSSLFGTSLQGVELFPTEIRSSAGGIIGFAGRIGSLVAPQIILMGELINPTLPMIILGVFLVISGSATFLIPETLNKKLPNTLQDIQDAWK